MKKKWNNNDIFHSFSNFNTEEETNGRAMSAVSSRHHSGGALSAYGQTDRQWLCVCFSKFNGSLGCAGVWRRVSQGSRCFDY